MAYASWLSSCRSCLTFGLPRLVPFLMKYMGYILCSLTEWQCLQRWWVVVILRSPRVVDMYAWTILWGEKGMRNVHTFLFPSFHLYCICTEYIINSTLYGESDHESYVEQTRIARIDIRPSAAKNLQVLGCRYVDDVLLDAPWQVTPEMIATLRLLERQLQVLGFWMLAQWIIPNKQPHIDPRTTTYMSHSQNVRRSVSQRWAKLVSNDRTPKLSASQVMIVYDCSCSFACHQRRSFRTTYFWGFQSNLTHRNNNCNGALMTTCQKKCASQEEGIYWQRSFVSTQRQFLPYNLHKLPVTLYQILVTSKMAYHRMQHVEFLQVVKSAKYRKTIGPTKIIIISSMLR